MTYLATAFNFLGVRGLIAAGLGAALIAVMWRADSISDDRDKYRDKLASEEARHSITRQSVNTLETALARFVGEGKARRAAQLAAVEAQAEKSEALRRTAMMYRAELATLTPDEFCTTPDFVMEGRQ